MLHVIVVEPNGSKLSIVYQTMLMYQARLQHRVSDHVNVSSSFTAALYQTMLMYQARLQQHCIRR